MIDRTKLKRVLVVGMIALLALGIAVTGFVLSSPSSSKESRSPKHSSLRVTSSSESSSVVRPSESQGSSSETQEKALESFLENYQTQKLDSDALTERNRKLQKEMTSAAYDASEISDTTTSLIQMVEKYQKTKTIDTSNSTQLVEQIYISSKIYQQANGVSDSYYVEVTYTERPIYQKIGTSMLARYNITMIDNKVESLALIDQKPA